MSLAWSAACAHRGAAHGVVRVPLVVVMVMVAFVVVVWAIAYRG